jgi:hypothetical protein
MTSNINDFVRNDRKSQNMRGALLLKKLARKERRVEPWIAALPDHELDSHVARTVTALKATPRSGLRRFLLALTAEKSNRALRRR